MLVSKQFNAAATDPLLFRHITPDLWYPHISTRINSGAMKIIRKIGTRVVSFDLPWTELKPAQFALIHEHRPSLQALTFGPRLLERGFLYDFAKSTWPELRRLEITSHGVGHGKVGEAVSLCLESAPSLEHFHFECDMPEFLVNVGHGGAMLKSLSLMLYHVNTPYTSFSTWHLGTQEELFESLPLLEELHLHNCDNLDLQAAKKHLVNLKTIWIRPRDGDTFRSELIDDGTFLPRLEQLLVTVEMKPIERGHFSYIEDGMPSDSIWALSILDVRPSMKAVVTVHTEYIGAYFVTRRREDGDVERGDTYIVRRSRAELRSRNKNIKLETDSDVFDPTAFLDRYQIRLQGPGGIHSIHEASWWAFDNSYGHALRQYEEWRYEDDTIRTFIDQMSQGERVFWLFVDPSGHGDVKRLLEGTRSGTSSDLLLPSWTINLQIPRMEQKQEDVLTKERMHRFRLFLVCLRFRATLFSRLDDAVFRGMSSLWWEPGVYKNFKDIVQDFADENIREHDILVDFWLVERNLSGSKRSRRRNAARR